jgi:hypothetical protein
MIVESPRQWGGLGVKGRATHGGTGALRLHPHGIYGGRLGGDAALFGGGQESRGSARQAKPIRAPLGGEDSGHFPVTAFFISQLSKDRAYKLLSALGCWKLGGLGVKGRTTHRGTGALRDTHPTGEG